jgi:hypothetical protein
MVFDCQGIDDDDDDDDELNIINNMHGSRTSSVSNIGFLLNEIWEHSVTCLKDSNQ